MFCSCEDITWSSLNFLNPEKYCPLNDWIFSNFNPGAIEGVLFLTVKSQNFFIKLKISKNLTSGNKKLHDETWHGSGVFLSCKSKIFNPCLVGSRLNVIKAGSVFDSILTCLSLSGSFIISKLNFFSLYFLIFSGTTENCASLILPRKCKMRILCLVTEKDNSNFPPTRIIPYNIMY